MEKILIVLFLFIYVAQWTEGKETQISRQRFVVDARSSCNDEIANCAAYTTVICFSIEIRVWALKVCARFCNFCHSTITFSAGSYATGTGTRSLVPASLESFDDILGSSGCFYKNQIYQEGASWNDGCNYTCRCLDGRSGLYHCKRSICKVVNSANFPDSEKLLHSILGRKNQRHLSRLQLN